MARNALGASRAQRLVKVLLEGLATPAPCPLDSLVEDYLAAQSLVVCSAHAKITASRLRRLVVALRARALGVGAQLDDALDLDSSLAVKYMRERLAAGRAPATVRGDLVALQAALTWGVREGRLEASPLAHLRLPQAGRAHQRRPRARYTQPELQSLVQAAQAMDKDRLDRGSWRVPQAPLLIVSIWTGLRLGEQLALTYGDLDAQARSLKVRAETAKSRKVRVVPLREEPLQAIVGLFNTHTAVLGRHPTMGDRLFLGARPHVGSRLRPNWVWQWFQGLLRTAGLAPVDAAGFVRTWHGLRHAAIDQVASGNIRAAQLLAGHASSRTTEGYMHRADDLVRAALEAVPTWSGPISHQSDTSKGGDHDAQQLSDLPPVGLAGPTEGEMAEREGFEPSVPVSQDTRLAICKSLQRSPRTARPPQALELAELPPGTQVLVPSLSALLGILRIAEALSAALRDGPVLLHGREATDAPR